MQEDQHSLKSGTILEKYKIIRVLGEGGFGITYLAEDIHLGLKVVIKEYFPNEFAVRSAENTITAKSKSIEDFAKGMKRFKEEAQTLAKFNHPSIVKILGYFETNDTAYFVMEYEEGIDLSQYLKQEKRALTQEEILSIIMPILEGLKEVHKYNYLHRDIKPGNILLRSNKSPVLIDFGASKLALGEASKSITSMLTEGYAPLEQYSTDIKQQGPFTDIYAISAVMYKMITGDVPPSAQTRSYQYMQDDNDPFQPLVGLQLKGYDESFLKAIDRALSMKAKDRRQDVQEFQKDIAGELKPAKQNSEKIYLSNNESGQKIKVWLWLFIGVSVVIAIGVFLIQNNQTDLSENIAHNTEVKESLETVKDEKAKEGVALYKEQCDNGEALGCTNLGVMYNNGAGVVKDEVKAVSLYKQGCDGGESRGCTNLGWMYNNGIGVEKDEGKAVSLYKQGCEEGDALGCTRLGLNTKDKAKAVTRYKQGCDGGNALGCTVLGVRYEDGYGVEKDTLKAASLYKQACDGGDALGCTRLGMMYASSKDKAKAVTLYKQGCDGGNALGCTNLGWMYNNGIGVEKDEGKALSLLKQGCEEGDALGCTRLGLNTKDKAKAVTLYKQGCDGGNALGCTNLGWMYNNGTGVEKDTLKAVSLYKQACDGGDALGCTRLGMMYASSKDKAKAVTLYKQSCDGGNALGCTNLGWMYNNGIGVEKDEGKAVSLYKQGCEEGDALGCTRLGLNTKDKAKAVTLYKQGCDGGNALGCTNLGWMYNNGIGVEKDEEKALSLLKQGCEEGDALGCTRLGLNTKDKAKAVTLYKQGCDGGNALGCTILGVRYEDGYGVEKDTLKAASLYRQACDGGDDEGCTRYKGLVL